MFHVKQLIYVSHEELTAGYTSDEILVDTTQWIICFWYIGGN